MARTFTCKPYLIRKEIYPVSSVAVAPGATVELATAAPLAFHPSWPTAEVKVQYDFIGSASAAGASSKPQMQMVADFGGTGVVRGQSIIATLQASQSILWSWRFAGKAQDSPAFANGSVLQLQGLNPGGVGTVVFDGFLTIEVYAQEAP